MNLKDIKKGDVVIITAYTGTSKAEADAVYNYLNDYYQRLQPAPFQGTKFKLKIMSVERVKSPPSEEKMVYPEQEKGLMKGEVI